MTDIEGSRQHAQTLNQKIQSEISDRSVTALRDGARAAITINGAAAVAILGFIGSVTTKAANAQVLNIPQLQFPLLVFAIGVTLGALTFVFQHLYQEVDAAIFEQARRDRNFDVTAEKNDHQYWAAGLLVASLVAFFVGCCLAAARL